MSVSPRHIAYLSLQAVVDGQDTWAAVTEIIGGWEAQGWTVDRYFPDYPDGVAPGPIGRLREMYRVQRRLAARLTEYDAIYVRVHPIAYRIAGLAHRAGVPVIQECNGPYEDLFIAWPQAKVARPWFEHVQRVQYRRASAIIAVSTGLADWVRAESGNQHVVTNGNGANVDIFTPDAPRRVGLPPRYAVFFGQFPAWQGIGTLLEAVRLPTWPRELPLVFVGDGAMRPAVEASAAELAPGRIVYLGRLPYDEVPGVVAHASVSFVPMLAPEREALFSPLKLYESMACGVPVVASRTVGITEVVEEHECGILVTAGDAEAFASATAALLADCDTASEMGRRGRAAAVDRYSWRARALQRASVIEAAIERSSE